MPVSPRFSLPTAVKRLVWYWLPVVGLCVAIFVQSAYPSPQTLPSWPFSDKMLHAGVYGLLAALLARALNNHDRWQGRFQALWIGAFAATALYGLSDEWHQSFVSARSADPVDFLADGIGAAVGAWVYLRWKGGNR